MAAITCGITIKNVQNVVPEFAYLGTCHPETMGINKINRFRPKRPLLLSPMLGETATRPL